MKKLFPFFLITLVISYCGKKDKDVTPEVFKSLKPIKGEYIVVLKEKSIVNDGKIKNPSRTNQYKLNSVKRKNKKAKVEQVLKKYAVNIDTTKYVYTDIVVGFKAKLTDDQARLLRADADVDQVYNDFEIKLRNPMQQSEIIIERNPMQQDFVDTVRWITCAVNLTGGPRDGSTKETVVWVVDTGVDSTHPDLNVVNDPILAFSVFPGDSPFIDGNGHGTHVAGIIGALENEIGSTGVSSGAKIIPVKVMEANGRGTWSYLLAGIEHIARYNSDNDVVNLSLGANDVDLCKQSSVDFRVIREALRDLAKEGTHVVIASGNESADAANSLPGCINFNNIYTVAAMDCDSTFKQCADYANFGKPVDWVAVGTNVFSTYPGGVYRLMSGTSMATAVVSGIIHANGGEPLEGGKIQCPLLTTPGTPRYKIAKIR
ncbi:MAG: S8 family serine peptidase [Cyclobacteriaceae bacterium]|nr:S8 family serine peptidase [Cyclobacteriaceae bacterium]